eukprot:503234-Hanusia_phi.AAC.3
MIIRDPAAAQGPAAPTLSHCPGSGTTRRVRGGGRAPGAAVACLMDRPGPCDVRELPWNNVSVSVQQCNLNQSWEYILSQRNSGIVQTGGLGQLMHEGRFEVWVCDYDCPCVIHVIDAACFVYDEMNESFLPWGLQSSLDLMAVS